jgi:predicted protein tyrosine phosphatase
MRNRLANARNPFQGDRKKVLCVCSAGLLRSPTAAWILSNEPFNFNTRACGAEPEYALIPLDEALVYWADEVVVMETWQAHEVEEIAKALPWGNTPKIHVLSVPDNYGFRDAGLVDAMLPKLKEIFLEDSPS